MGATLSLLKTLVVPAIISLILFLLVTYAIVPFWKRYKARYSQYLPLDAISSQTSSFRQRVQAGAARYLAPSNWRPDSSHSQFSTNSDVDIDGAFGDEDGEELSGVDEHRRLALSLDARRGAVEDRRLSRDLEEGFRDDSDDEVDGNNLIN